MQAKKRSLTILVIAIAVGAVYFVTEQMNRSEDADSEPASTEQAATSDEPPAEDAADDEGEDGPASLTEEERLALRQTATIVTDHYEAEVDGLSGGVASFRLTGDPRFTNEGVPLEVVTTPDFHPLRVQLPGIDIPDDAVWQVTQVSEREVRLTWVGEGVRVVRTLMAGQGPYQLWSTTRIVNTSDEPRDTRLEMFASHYVTRESESGGMFAMMSRSTFISHATCVYDGETERKDRDKLVEEGVHGYGDGDVHVAAVESVYFVVAMASTDDQTADRCALSASNRGGTVEDPLGSLFEARLIYPWVTLEPGGERTYRTLAYLGPKEPDALNTAGHGLPAVVDLGFFALIAGQLARLLGFIQQYVPNWGLAIILLTLMIRLTLFPLTNMSFSSMARMRRLKPEIDRINELYKDDAEKKGAAVMELYRKHKINPLSGCLPSLVQLPVWWALYTSLSTNIELYHMPFTLWWQDLSAPDPYYVLPILLGALMHLQQRISPTTMDPAQAKMMMYFMPIMITVFMLFLPSGLCLYMLTNSALGIGQQKLNEVRLSREVPVAEASVTDDGDDLDDGDDEASDNPHKRRPKRKRRVRRGRA